MIHVCCKDFRNNLYIPDTVQDRVFTHHVHWSQWALRCKDIKILASYTYIFEDVNVFLQSKVKYLRI